MKILYVVGHYIPHIGGVEILFEQYVTGMLGLGHEVRVVTSSSGGITGKKVINGAEIYGYEWGMLFGHPLARASDIAEHVRWADIVHTTTFTVADPARKMCKKYKKPCLITIHEVLGDKWYWIEPNKIKALGYRLFEKYVCCKPYDHIHVISNATKNDYLKYYGKRDNIRMLYNCIDDSVAELPSRSDAELKKVFGINDDSRTFLYFGRPGQSKGIFVLLEAIEILRGKYSEYLDGYKFCFIISNDPAKQRKIFENRVSRGGLSEYVKIHGSMKREDLFKVISECDCVIVPSITEGFGFCAAEACALGKNLIYSSGGSLPEVVSGNTLEFTNRSSEDLADKILKVIRNGEAAFEHTESKSFDKDTMIRGLAEYYAEITKTRRAE